MKANIRLDPRIHQINSRYYSMFPFIWLEHCCFFKYQVKLLFVHKKMEGHILVFAAQEGLMAVFLVVTTKPGPQPKRWKCLRSITLDIYYIPNTRLICLAYGQGSILSSYPREFCQRLGFGTHKSSGANLLRLKFYLSGLRGFE